LSGIFHKNTFDPLGAVCVDNFNLGARRLAVFINVSSINAARDRFEH